MTPFVQAIISISILGVVAALFYAASRLRKGGAQEQLPFPDSSAGIDKESERDSTPPISDGVKLVVRNGGNTARELRREEIKARAQTGMCLYCDLPATQAQPTLYLPVSIFDKLYRRLGVVPVARWIVRSNPRSFFTFKDSQSINAEHPVCLCDTHHAMARAHLERKVAENQMDYATFVTKQRLEMYEYQAHALDECMLQDTVEIRRGKKKKGTQEAGQRAQLKAVPGSG